MCEPTTIAIAALVMGAGAGIYQADAEQKSANYSAKVDENNAQIATYQAKAAATIGSVEEERHRAKVRQMVGTQRAALAGNGLDLGEGTALDLVTETAGLGEEDALTIRYNAMREAWGYNEQAKGYKASAGYKRVAGKNAATGTLLTTAANTLSGAYNLKAGTA